MLYVHMKKAHAPTQWDRLSSEHAAVYHAVSPAYRQCLLWKCRKSLPLTDFTTHVKLHCQDDLMAIAAALDAENYVLVKANCPHSGGNPGVNATPSLSCPCPFQALRIRCPVCTVLCEDTAAFTTHLDEHIIRPEHLNHFQTWRTHAQAKDVWQKSEQFSALIPWNLRKDVEFDCPSCAEHWSIIKYRPRVGEDHHLQLLAPSEELKPYRRQILRLYPDFIESPVWDDLAQPLGGIEGEPSTDTAAP